MERQSFTFYRSFLDAIESLPKSARGEAALALVRYGLNSEAPGDNCKPGVKTVYLGAKAVIDKGARRAEAGRKGGMASNRQANGKPDTYTNTDTNTDTSTATYTDANAAAAMDSYAAPAEDETLSMLSAAGVPVERHTDEIVTYAARYGKHKIEAALCKALNNGAHSWAYIRSVLDNDAKAAAARNGGYQQHDQPPSPMLLEAMHRLEAESRATACGDSDAADVSQLPQEDPDAMGRFAP